MNMSRWLSLLFLFVVSIALASSLARAQQTGGSEYEKVANVALLSSLFQPNCASITGCAAFDS